MICMGVEENIHLDGKQKKYEKWMGSNHWCKKEGKKRKKECYEEMDGDQ